MQIASNLVGLARVRLPGVNVRVEPFTRAPGGWWARLRACRRALKNDYVVINSATADLLDVCLAKMLLPLSRGRIISLDTVLPIPQADSFAARIRLWIKKALFRQCHLFIEYFKQTEGYERHYGFPRQRFRYVPFKINRYERVLATPSRDDGYIFCGGNTRRDFRTLIEAVRDLPIPVKLVTMRDEIIAGHGSVLDERHLPPNVEVIRHDGSDSFVDYMAAARMVVLPIRRANISASGIGVYLAAMALGKCVIISEGPAVNGIVPEDAAVVVPPEDPAALREAITRVHRDDAFREAVAGAAQKYALSLGGEDRLCASVAGVVVADWRERQNGAMRMMPWRPKTY
jgi:glycosyltransferase involved in cell wall biosynthesis